MVSLSTMARRAVFAAMGALMLTGVGSAASQAQTLNGDAVIAPALEQVQYRDGYGGYDEPRHWGRGYGEPRRFDRGWERRRWERMQERRRWERMQQRRHWERRSYDY